MKNSTTLFCTMAVAALLSACKNEDLSAPKAPKMNPSVAETMNSTTPVSQVGITPAGPTKEAAATTSSSKSDVSKADQSASMPLTGQAGDHSAIVPKTSEFPKTSP